MAVAVQGAVGLSGPGAAAVWVPVYQPVAVAVQGAAGLICVALYSKKLFKQIIFIFPRKMFS